MCEILQNFFFMTVIEQSQITTGVCLPQWHIVFLIFPFVTHFIFIRNRMNEKTSFYSLTVRYSLSPFSFIVLMYFLYQRIKLLVGARYLLSEKSNVFCHENFHYSL